MKKNRGRIAAIIMMIVMAGVFAGCGNISQSSDLDNEVSTVSEMTPNDVSESEEQLLLIWSESKETETVSDSASYESSEESAVESSEESAVESSEESAVESAANDEQMRTQERDTAPAESKAASTPTPVSESNESSETPIQTPTAEQQENVKPVQTPAAGQQEDVKPSQTVPASSETPAAPQSTPAPAHTHSWTEAGRSESTDCFAGITTTTVSHSCNCGETKTETQTASSNCDWQWVGEWHYDYSGCFKQRTAYHTCTTHGTTTTEMPKFEEVDEHDYCEHRTEPSCETKGEVTVVCSKCGMHFPDKSYSITNDRYPDGGGNGHNFVESSRRDLNEEETAWFGEGKAMATYTCSACGFSYDDIVNK